MIECRLHHLEERCAERGYTIEEVSGCVVSQEGDVLVVDETHAAYPRHKKPVGLGDMVAQGLSSVGITPERVAKITKKPCGCKKRQEKLNEFGRKFGIGKGK
jgi:hypothetical protein